MKWCCWHRLISEKHLLNCTNKWSANYKKWLTVSLNWWQEQSIEVDQVEGERKFKSAEARQQHWGLNLTNQHRQNLPEAETIWRSKSQNNSSALQWTSAISVCFMPNQIRNGSWTNTNTHTNEAGIDWQSVSLVDCLRILRVNLDLNNFAETTRPHTSWLNGMLWLLVFHRETSHVQEHRAKLCHCVSVVCFRFCFCI